MATPPIRLPMPAAVQRLIALAQCAPPTGASAMIVESGKECCLVAIWHPEARLHLARRCGWFSSLPWPTAMLLPFRRKWRVRISAFGVQHHVGRYEQRDSVYSSGRLSPVLSSVCSSQKPAHCVHCSAAAHLLWPGRSLMRDLGLGQLLMVICLLHAPQVPHPGGSSPGV